MVAVHSSMTTHYREVARVRRRLRVAADGRPTPGIVGTVLMGRGGEVVLRGSSSGGIRKRRSVGRPSLSCGLVGSRTGRARGVEVAVTLPGSKSFRGAYKAIVMTVV